MSRYERRPRHEKKSDPMVTFFKATMGVLLALVLAATLFAGGCCGLLIGVSKSIEDEQHKEQEQRNADGR